MAILNKQFSTIDCYSMYEGVWKRLFPRTSQGWRWNTEIDTSDQNSPSYITKTANGESLPCNEKIRLVTRKSKRITVVSHWAHPPAESPKRYTYWLIQSLGFVFLSSTSMFRCFTMEIHKQCKFPKKVGPKCHNLSLDCPDGWALHLHLREMIA